MASCSYLKMVLSTNRGFQATDLYYVASFEINYVPTYTQNYKYKKMYTFARSLIHVNCIILLWTV